MLTNYLTCDYHIVWIDSWLLMIWRDVHQLMDQRWSKFVGKLLMHAMGICREVIDAWAEIMQFMRVSSIEIFIEVFPEKFNWFW